MSYTATHILYEWEDTTEVTIRGEVHRYKGDYHSIIVHGLDTLQCFHIPETAMKTPVWYSTYNERWMLANGKPLTIPYKLR